MLDAECLKCRVPGIHDPRLGWSSPPKESPWAIAVAVFLPIAFPPLVLVCWPVLSYLFARRLFLRHAARQEDLFLKIILGILLSGFGGIAAFAVLFFTCSSGVALWGALASLFR
jgi:hypothetical protein